MATQAEVQGLLRFLAQDAKVPLKEAMGKIKALQNAKLTSPAVLSSTPLPTIQEIFPDQKIAKQILSAAKRVSKKRPADATSSNSTHPSSPSSKRLKPTTDDPNNTDPESLEAALALPAYSGSDEALASTTLLTNRAPLMLAFTLTLLSHSMPKQPLSSRLSLAQAVVSANSRSKALSIGIRNPYASASASSASSSAAANEETLLEGLRRVRIMGRDVGVLRRAVPGMDQADPPLWGVDVEALHSDKARPTSATGDLPVHTAESARAYLLKSFLTPVEKEGEEGEEGGGGGGGYGGGSSGTRKASKKKKTGKALVLEREGNLGMLLRALEVVFSSWMDSVLEEDWHGLGMDELERRAWGWYVRTRPEVQEGRSGWGEKGEIKLGEILALRRPIKKKDVQAQDENNKDNKREANEQA